MVFGHGVSALREHAEKTNGRAGRAVADCVRYRTTDGNTGTNAKSQTIGNGSSIGDAVAKTITVTAPDG